MKILRERGFELQKDDYLVLKQMLLAVNDTIHHYEDYKSTSFNFRKFKMHARQLKQDDEEILRFKRIKDEEINEVVYSLRIALFSAFFAYTPLMKYGFAIFLLSALFKTLAALGVNSINGMISFLSWLDKESSSFPRGAIKV